MENKAQEPLISKQFEQWRQLPIGLRELPQWVVAGKDKIPLKADRNKASVIDASTWCDFDTACKVVQDSGLGIGFVITKNDPFTCIDIDIVDQESQSAKGQVIDSSKWTSEDDFDRYRSIIKNLNSYTEISFNGKGVHIWVRGNIGSGMRRDGIEVYSQERYMICTGNTLVNRPIVDAQSFLDNMQLQMKPQVVKTGLEELPQEMEDHEIIELAINAANKDKFNQLCNGDISGYPSQSEADLALLSMFTFYSQSNAQCKRLFRMSALGQREKAVRDDKYLDNTLRRIRSSQSSENIVDLSQIEIQAQACINKARQDEWVKNNAKETPTSENSSTDSALFSLAKFTLKGCSESMKKHMLKEVHILHNIALLGQITAIYAKPNTGKTLITIRLLIDAINTGTINGDDVFYVNADDSYRGLIEKIILAEKYGFHMLAPRHNGFESKDLADYIMLMINENSVKGKIIILDTLKKFVDLMDKKNSSIFMNFAREFSSHGGSLILLAHTNKHRDANGKVVAGGTSDIIDDADCSFTLDEVSCVNGIKTVLFENKKLRGNVALESGYTYSIDSNQSYEDRVNSVMAQDENNLQYAKNENDIAKELKKDRPIIDAIIQVLHLDNQLKTDLVNIVNSDSGFSKRLINVILEKYEGKSVLQGHMWHVIPADKNSKIYTLLTTDNCDNK